MEKVERENSPSPPSLVPPELLVTPWYGLSVDPGQIALLPRLFFYLFLLPFFSLPQDRGYNEPGVPNQILAQALKDLTHLWPTLLSPQKYTNSQSTALFLKHIDLSRSIEYGCQLTRKKMAQFVHNLNMTLACRSWCWSWQGVQWYHLQMIAGIRCLLSNGFGWDTVRDEIWFLFP